MKIIYYNGQIITMEKEGARVPALMTEDGWIRALGDAKTLIAEHPDARLRDLEGKTLMPAFVDGHSHFLMAMQIGNMADLSDCGSFAELRSALQQFAAEKKIGSDGVMIGGG